MEYQVGDVVEVIDNRFGNKGQIFTITKIDKEHEFRWHHGSHFYQTFNNHPTIRRECSLFTGEIRLRQRRTKMKPKYKFKERVQLHCYEALKRQYGLAEYEKLEIDGIDMEIRGRHRFLGSIVTIKNFNIDGTFVIEEDEHRFCFPISIIAHNLTYGEDIQVSCDRENWNKSIFVSYNAGAEKPYTCVNGFYEKEFKRGEKYSTTDWRYARKIQKQPELIKVGDICFDKAEFEEATKNLRQYKGD